MSIKILSRLLSLSALLACACQPVNRFEGRQAKHHEPELGLSLAYPDDWKFFERSELAQLPGVLGTIGNRPGVYFMVLRLGDRNDVSRNPNLLVSAMVVSPDDCSTVSTDTFAHESAQQFQTYFPNAVVIDSGARNKWGRAISTFSAGINLGNRNVMHHRYFYCFKNRIVQIETSSSDGSGEEGLQKILSSIEVEQQLNNGSGDS
jgi:hypothetical protein